MHTTAPAAPVAYEINPASSRARVTPLARAALANGVAFEDVAAYVQGSRDLNRAVFEEFFTHANAPDVQAVELDIVLDSALARSVLAQGTIEHARLFWRGVL